MSARAAAEPSGAVRVGGGMHGMLPMATVGAEVGVSPRVAVEGRYDLVAGLAHDFGLGARVRLPRAWSLSLFTSNGFFAEEELDGIVLADAPFGNGLTSTLTATWTLTTRRATRVGLGFGATARWFAPESDLGTMDREVEPRLHHVHGEVSADWPGGTFLRVRALVPVQAEFHVIGYLPLVAAGHTWALP